MKDLFEGMDVEAIIQLLPPDQHLHLLNVKFLVHFLAEKVALCCHNEGQLKNVELKNYGEAAFFHDIGKACISNRLLTKTEKLTEKEFDMLRMHTIFAKELFVSIKQDKIHGVPQHLLSLAEDAAVYHHEWWNGEGYPYGYQGREIPFIARITAICDAYDAITNTRVYRKANSHAYACEELMKYAGRQFDPDLVKIFLQYEEELLHRCPKVRFAL
ncbi:MAG: metal dependent phosphohydrolase [Anaerocolumna sp.]|nr:metal dependent phosphohydrolase [Anaerocolumna sp.]